MTKFITLLSVLSIFFCSTRAQNDTDFKEFVIMHNYIWALSTAGKIKIFDIENSCKLVNKNIAANSGITDIAKDKNGSIVIAKNNKEIKRYDEKNNSWEVIANSKSEVIGIVFTNKNVCYGIDSNGIENLSTNKFYISYSDMFTNYHSDVNFNFVNPESYYIDRHDNIWVGFGHGEWGGHLCVLKTKNKKSFFKTTGLPVRSFFEDSNFVYSSSSLQHMGVISGEIDRFDDFNPSPLFRSESKRDESLNDNNKIHMLDGEYIGPATFNSFNNSFYFYSQNGIYRGDKSKDLSKIESWQQVLIPYLHWKYGQPDAVGSQMNVLKITSIDKNRFLFLSQSDGIGYFDGEKLIMLK